MNRDGVMEAEPDERLSVLSALDETQLVTRGTLPRRSVLTSGFSQLPSGHSKHCIHTTSTSNCAQTQQHAASILYHIISYCRPRNVLYLGCTLDEALQRLHLQ